MTPVEQKTQELIDAIKESPEYVLYREQLTKVSLVAGLKEQIDIFRERNFELQNSEDNAFDKIEAFEKEYETFRENPLVSDFLAAELQFCRMLQNVTYKVTDAVDFQ